MILLLIILGFIALGVCLLLLYKILKWVLKKKVRTIWAFSILGILIVCITINTLFFIKMEFIQSKVYPHVYLVKNQIDDREEIKAIVKKMIIEKMNPQIHGDKEILKTTYNYSYRSRPETNASIQFYEYYDTWGVIPFGEAGTAHFIENEEDPGGFSSELLEHYQNYKIAEFTLRYCTNDTINYFGHLTYWYDGKIIKTDTLFNSCNP